MAALSVNGGSVPAHAAEGAGTPRPVNILLVDDLPDKHVALRAVLEELQQNIVSVYSGSEALRAILEQDFAVILLDVNMPDIDGFETARLIRGYRRTAKTPIVFISAYVDEELAIRGYALGAVDYIASPVVPQILRSKVRVFVELHLANQQLREQALEREALIRAEAAQATAEQASRRAIFLEQVSQAFTRSIEIDCIVQVLLENTIPTLARWGAVSLKYESSYIDRMAEADSALAVQVRSFAPGEALRAQVQAVVQTRTQRTLERGDPDHVAAFEGVNNDTATSLVLLPLVSGRRALGALVLAFAREAPASESTLAMAIELASRASFALENAYLYKAIQDADQRKNEFLAMLAHELRNPLAPIRNAASVIAALQTGGERMRWAAEVIERQVQHMTHIVDDLLDLSRVASGKIGIAKQWVELRAVVARAIETSEPLIRARAQELVVRQSEANAMLEGDLVRLAQVLSNLLNNACKFTPEGGTITVTTGLEGSEAMISVKDTGRGITPEFLPHVFDLFAQAAPSLDRSEGGLGIGLTLVKHLVELHQGTVQVHSEGAQRGCEFVIRLPAVPAQGVLAETAQVQPAPASASAPMRVLVVDDLALSAETLTLLLEMNGHAVATAFDGAQALAQFDSFHPNVVVLDIGLPDLNGYEIARLLRQRKPVRPVLLVALSGYGNEIDKRRAVEAGFDHYFVKPANIDRLLAVIGGVPAD
jgi:signal transduction histidine kinase